MIGRPVRCHPRFHEVHLRIGNKDFPGETIASGRGRHSGPRILRERFHGHGGLTPADARDATGTWETVELATCSK